MEEVINLLKQLVSIRSIYPNEEKIGNFIETYFNQKNYKVIKQKVEENRFNLIVEKGSGKKTIALYSHLDTVDTTSLMWKSNPFELKISGDKAYGLGAFDMKGGMAINMLSFLKYNPRNFRLRLFFVVDEENISKGGWRLAESEFIKDVNCIISTEPSFYYGNQGIVIGRPGRTVFQLILKTKPVHYALYEESKDLNYFLAVFIEKLKTLNKKFKDKKQFLYIKKIETQVFGMSTINQINIELDSSILPPNDNISILKKLKDITNIINRKFKFDVLVKIKERETPYLNGYQLERNNQFLEKLKLAIKETTKKEPVPYFRSSIADENIFGYKKIPTFGIGPIGGNAHAANEWVSIKSLMFLREIIIKFFELLELN